MREQYDMAVVTNDIYTKEDQRLLTVSGALPAERIMGVETGGCPHTAIREDVVAVERFRVDVVHGGRPVETSASASVLISSSMTSVAEVTTRAPSLINWFVPSLARDPIGPGTAITSLPCSSA